MDDIHSALFGQILPSPGGPDLDRDDWISLIDRHQNLVRPEPVQRINPFTGEPMTVKSSRDFAHVVAEKERIGSCHWFMNEENGICVQGISPALTAIAIEIAESLGGRFVCWEEGANA